MTTISSTRMQQSSRCSTDDEKPVSVIGAVTDTTASSTLNSNATTNMDDDDVRPTTMTTTTTDITNNQSPSVVAAACHGDAGNVATPLPPQLTQPHETPLTASTSNTNSANAHTNNTATQQQQQSSSSSSSSRVCVRLVPGDAAAGDAVRAVGGHPYVEVVLKGAKSIWDVTAHLFTKWCLPVRVHVNGTVPPFRTRLCTLPMVSCAGRHHAVIDARFTLAKPGIPAYVFDAAVTAGLIAVPNENNDDDDAVDVVVEQDRQHQQENVMQKKNDHHQQQQQVPSGLSPPVPTTCGRRRTYAPPIPPVPMSLPSQFDDDRPPRGNDGRGAMDERGAHAKQTPARRKHPLLAERKRKRKKDGRDDDESDHHDVKSKKQRQQQHNNDAATLSTPATIHKCNNSPNGANNNSINNVCRSSTSSTTASTEQGPVPPPSSTATSTTINKRRRVHQTPQKTDRVTDSKARSGASAAAVGATANNSKRVKPFIRVMNEPFDDHHANHLVRKNPSGGVSVSLPTACPLNHLLSLDMAIDDDDDADNVDLSLIPELSHPSLPLFPPRPPPLPAIPAAAATATPDSVASDDTPMTENQRSDGRSLPEGGKQSTDETDTAEEKVTANNFTPEKDEVHDSFVSLDHSAGASSAGGAWQADLVTRNHANNDDTAVVDESPCEAQLKTMPTNEATVGSDGGKKDNAVQLDDNKKSSTALSVRNSDPAQPEQNDQAKATCEARTSDEVPAAPENEQATERQAVDVDNECGGVSAGMGVPNVMATLALEELFQGCDGTHDQGLVDELCKPRNEVPDEQAVNDLELPPLNAKQLDALFNAEDDDGHPISSPPSHSPAPAPTPVPAAESASLSTPKPAPILAPELSAPSTIPEQEPAAAQLDLDMPDIDKTSLLQQVSACDNNGDDANEDLLAGLINADHDNDMLIETSAPQRLPSAMSDGMRAVDLGLNDDDLNSHPCVDLGDDDHADANAMLDNSDHVNFTQFLDS